jgi:hypothetical protein
MNYLLEVADRIRRFIPPALLPPDAGPLLLIYAVLARAKGEATSAEDVHNAWNAWMLIRGEHHESMRAFEELPEPVRREDEPFLNAIRAAANEESTHA